jgi:hypothetical protein
LLLVQSEERGDEGLGWGWLALSGDIFAVGPELGCGRIVVVHILGKDLELSVV